MVKLVILVRKDLDMSAGKTAAQVSHAVLKSFMNRMSNMGKRGPDTECIDYSEDKLLSDWLKTGQTKVVLEVADLAELELRRSRAITKELHYSIVVDEGRTEIAPSTITCMAIGPDESERIDEVAGDLKLLK